MSLISVKNLTFAYDGAIDNVFDNVSFEIDTDLKLGFIGRNGRGKTTFLKLLLNLYEYTGVINASGVVFDYFPFDVPDKSKATIDAAADILGEFELWRLSKEFSLLGVSDDILYREFAILSKGEQTKVLLAIMFVKQDNFLLIDEPTNHLDMHGRKTVSDYLKRKKGFILVSHDRNFLDNVVDHVLSINKANIEVQKGNFTTWYQNKKMEDNFETEQNEKLKKEIKKLTQSAKQAAVWSDKVEKTKYGTKTGGLKPDRGFIGHKSAKMMKRAKTIERRCDNAAEEKSKLLKNIEEEESLKIQPLKHHKAKILEYTDVGIKYGADFVCGGINFCVNAGERVLLTGKNGSGKSSILKIAAENLMPALGSIYKPSKLIVSYVSQDTSFLVGSLKTFVKDNNIDETLFKAILRKLDFKRELFEMDINNFSSGQKKKVLIAKSLCEQAHIYIWDEPLNFIDIISRIQIEDLILKYEPTMLSVEHDKEFARKIATKTIEVQRV